jgi:hypothetical protein
VSSAVVIIKKNAHLEELDTCVLNFLIIGCYEDIIGL